MSFAYVSRISQPTRTLYRGQRQQNAERAPVRKRIYDAAKALGFPHVAWSAHRLWEDLLLVASEQVQRGQTGLVRKSDARQLVRKQGGKMPASAGAARRMTQRRQRVLREAGALADWGMHVEPTFEPLEGANLWRETSLSSGGCDTLVAPLSSTNHHKIGDETQNKPHNRYGKQRRKSEVAAGKKRVGGRFVCSAKNERDESPPLASTACEKEKKEFESRLSSAKPATQCPEGATAWLLGWHPARLAWRRYRAEQRRAARRNASCESQAGGRVGSAMEGEWTTSSKSTPGATASEHCPKKSEWQRSGISTAKTFCNTAGQANGRLSPVTTTTPISNDLSSLPQNAGCVGSSQINAIAQTNAVGATVGKTTLHAKTPSTKNLFVPMESERPIFDDAQKADEELLSPETLAAIPRLPFFLRESHRRTGRLMALKRIREGLPAWETAEERDAPDEQPERLTEAETRGFSARHKEKQTIALDEFLLRAPKRMHLASRLEDEQPADAMWLRYHLALTPELSRLPFLPAARQKIARKHWRAALAGLLYRPRSRVDNCAGFVAQAAQELAAGNGRDSRLSKWFTVQPGWSSRLAEAADALERMPGWEPAAWGPQQYA